MFIPFDRKSNMGASELAQIEAKARAALRDLMSKYDIAEFRAQQHASDMVDIVAGFARDKTLEPKFRKECALHVLDRAYGTVTTKTQVTMHTTHSQADDPVARDIDRATREAAIYLQISEYLGNGTPYDLWPTAVREAAGHMSEAFADIDGVAEEIAVDMPTAAAER